MDTSFLHVAPMVNTHESNPVGFFQFQCRLPGLLEALIPRFEAKGRPVIIRQGDDAWSDVGANPPPEGTCLIEFSTQPDGAYTMRPLFFMRLEGLANSWPRRLWH